MEHKNLLILFSVFFKIGLFTFGGGYSMLPLIENEICIKHKFINQDELTDMFSIAECTPGPISVNCATFIGYKVYKLKGAIISTLALVIPSFIIIIIISLFFQYFKNSQTINKFLSGIKIGIIPLLTSSILKLNSKSNKSYLHYTKICIIICILIFTNVNTITIILTSIIILIILFFIKNWRKISN